MAKIILHTPTYFGDYKTTTEFEADDIIQIKSVVGDDSKEGTHFWLRGIAKRWNCIESANKLKNMIQDNKTEEKPFAIIQSGSGNALAVGSKNQIISGKEGGWAISGWWITLIGTLIGIAALVLTFKN